MSKPLKRDPTKPQWPSAFDFTMPSKMLKCPNNPIIWCYTVICPVSRWPIVRDGHFVILARNLRFGAHTPRFKCNKVGKGTIFASSIFSTVHSISEIVNLKVQTIFYKSELLSDTNNHHLDFCRSKFHKGILFPDLTVYLFIVLIRLSLT